MDVDRAAASAQAACWRDAYPALLGCMIEGRRPSTREIETVAARMLRELGGRRAERSGAIERGGGRLLAAARVALEGERCRECGPPTGPLVPRGH